jgi:hypothetical protein
MKKHMSTQPENGRTDDDDVRRGISRSVARSLG